MYESPIELIITDITAQQEKAIFTAVQTVGVNVNKDELILALKFDRHQYDKGYTDGYEKAVQDMLDKLMEM